VGDGVAANPLGDIDQLLGDQRARNRGAEQVDTLVMGIGAEHREDVVADEFLAQVLDEDVFRLDAEQQRLLAGRFKLLALTEIGGKGHHLAIVGRLQPFQDDGGIKATGIGENHLFDRLLGHQRKLRRFCVTAGCFYRRLVSSGNRNMMMSYARTIDGSGVTLSGCGLVMWRKTRENAL
jgi:hypothetical protein